MSLTSYAQNGEDVLLWRALGHLPRGFYIDVGANDPELHSVTKAFYDAGWHGINIEPMPSYGAAFVAQRPRDINLNVAAGAAAGSITLFDIPAVNGWASTDQTVARAHRAEGYEVVEHTVPLRTLNDVCAEHVDGAIHFLKIDVEGYEGDVLRGIDLRRWRPWILVIEATLPNSRVTNHESWEALVTGCDYQFAWFDGLNRYYVAAEHPELLAALTIQPNVFDDYLPAALVKAWAGATAAEQAAADAARHADEMAARAALAEQLAAQAQAQAAASQADAERELARALAAEASAQRADGWGRELEHTLQALQASPSWRLTAPLRALARAGRAGRARLRAAVAALVVWLISRNSLRRLLLPLLARVPGLDNAVGALVRRAKAAPAPAPAHASAPPVPPELRALSAATRVVLADLQRARQRETE